MRSLPVSLFSFFLVALLQLCTEAKQCRLKAHKALNGGIASLGSPNPTDASGESALSGIQPTPTSGSSAGPAPTAFNYTRDKIRGVNLYVLSLQRGR